MKYNEFSSVQEGVVSNLGKGIAGAVRSGKTFSGEYQKGQGQDEANKAAKPWIKQWNMTVGRYPQGNTLDNLRNYATNMAGRISGTNITALDPATAGINTDPATDQIVDQKSVNKYITQVVGQALNAKVIGSPTAAAGDSAQSNKSFSAAVARGMGATQLGQALDANKAMQSSAGSQTTQPAQQVQTTAASNQMVPGMSAAGRQAQKSAASNAMLAGMGAAGRAASPSTTTPAAPVTPAPGTTTPAAPVTPAPGTKLTPNAFGGKTFTYNP